MLPVPPSFRVARPVEPETNIVLRSAGGTEYIAGLR